MNSFFEAFLAGIVFAVRDHKQNFSLQLRFG
jgi:hypothetical protein